jgi:membrane-associated phospholipid phosphatase
MSNSAADAGRERQPIHRLFAIYLLITAPALLFPAHLVGWPILLALHIAGAAVLLQFGPIRTWLGAVHRRFPRAAEVVADWYLLALIPMLYTELATLNKAVWNGHFFDDHVLRWEAALFGQPSQEFAARFNLLPLSEYLHFAYLSYYLIIYGPPLLLYLRGQRAAQRNVTFTIMLTFFAHYLFFVYFPVQGPRYLFDAPGGAIANGPVYQMTHKLLEAGSSQGAAFPSSHVGVAVAATMLALKYIRPLGIVLVAMTLSLALGAVYGGFHYATDAVAGLLLGLICVAIAPSIKKVLH